jgi:hypothetical protein
VNKTVVWDGLWNGGWHTCGLTRAFPVNPNAPKGATTNRVICFGQSDYGQAGMNDKGITFIPLNNT